MMTDQLLIVDLAVVPVFVNTGAALLPALIAGLTGFVAYRQVLSKRAVVATNTLGTQQVPHLDVRGTTYQDTAAAWD